MYLAGGFLSAIFHVIPRTRGDNMHTQQDGASRTRADARLRRLLWGISITALSCGVATTAGAAAAPASSIPAALFAGHPAAQTRQKLEAAFTELAKADLFSGTILIAKGNQVLFQGAYGLASREYGVPNRLETRLNLASAGKMFTTVAIGTLYDQGKLRFDDPVSKYLDASWIDPSVGSHITLGNLLSHTSGIPDYFGPDFLGRSRALFKKIDDYKPLIAGLKPTFAPGTQWSYSNTNFLLLGAVIEKVSGRSYDDYIREAIFKPTGMTRSGALDLEEVNHDYAQGYLKFPPPPPPPPSVRQEQPDFRQLAFMMSAAQDMLAKRGFQWHNNIFMHVAKGESSGGSFSTVGDLLAFGNALSDGRLLKPATLALMSSPKPSSPDYGYGFQLLDGGYGHTGGFPGINTAVVFYPDGYRLIVLSNVDGGSAVANAKLLSLGGVSPPK
jgi:CubicO group peptidase (beta-lactamase class C family)